MLRSTLTTVTSAFGITAPVLSSTIPVMVPVPTCAQPIAADRVMMLTRRAYPDIQPPHLPETECWSENSASCRRGATSHPGIYNRLTGAGWNARLCRERGQGEDGEVVAVQ